MGYRNVTFHFAVVRTPPGVTLYRLTMPWRHDDGVLPAGAEVQPLRSGYNSVTERHERTVRVVGTNKTVTGPF